MTADRGRHLAESARPLVVQAPETSPFTRKRRRIMVQAQTRPSLHGGRVVTNMSKRSDQEIALGRRAARMRRIDGLRSVAEMVQNPLDDFG